MKRYDILIAEENERTGKTYFHKVGSAWPNRSGDGFSLLFPPGVSVGGRVLMLPAKERTEGGRGFERAPAREPGSDDGPPPAGVDDFDQSDIPF